MAAEIVIAQFEHVFAGARLFNEAGPVTPEEMPGLAHGRMREFDGRGHVSSLFLWTWPVNRDGAASSAGVLVAFTFLDKVGEGGSCVLGQESEFNPKPFR